MSAPNFQLSKLRVCAIPGQEGGHCGSSTRLQYSTASHSHTRMQPITSLPRSQGGRGAWERLWRDFTVLVHLQYCTWKTSLPKISLHRTVDFGEYRKITSPKMCAFTVTGGRLITEID